MLNEAEENIYPLVGAHLATETTKNRKAAYQLALKTAGRIASQASWYVFLIVFSSILSPPSKS